MRRLNVIIILLMSVFSLSSAQSADEMERIMKFLGEIDPEELDQYEVERLSDMLERPMKINVSTASKMNSCGLFSRYQVASLMDYRARHGDVLSFTELAALDGFGNDYVDRVSPFISLYSPSLPGARADTSLAVVSDLAVRSGLKTADKDDPQWNMALKYRMEINEVIYASISLSRSASAPDHRPDAWTGAFAWHLRKVPVKIIAGDFNARFGQGLALWNGMTMSGLSSPSSLIRASTGISRSWSFTGSSSYTGLASEIDIGRFSISSMLAVPGIKSLRQNPEGASLLPALNLAWNGRRGHIGFTNYAELSGFFTHDQERRIPDMKTALDLSFCLDGTDLCSEVSFDWVTKALAGSGAVRFAAGENLRLAAMLRYYPPSYSAGRSGAARSGTKCSNEYAATFAGEFSAGDWVTINGAEGFGSSVRRHTGTFSLDAAYFPVPKKGADTSAQLKALASWEIMLSEAFRLKIRVSERLRSWDRPFRTDLRADLSWLSSRFEVNARANALHCVGIGFLSYIEGGYRYGKTAIYLRTGFYRIGNWDDRIYVYERDAPGSFNVPAFYGSGAWASATASWNFARWGRLYLRASKKPGKAELKVQGLFSF